MRRNRKAARSNSNRIQRQNGVWIYRRLKISLATPGNGIQLPGDRNRGLSSMLTDHCTVQSLFNQFNQVAFQYQALGYTFSRKSNKSCSSETWPFGIKSLASPKSNKFISRKVYVYFANFDSCSGVRLFS